MRSVLPCLTEVSRNDTKCVPNEYKPNGKMTEKHHSFENVHHELFMTVTLSHKQETHVYKASEMLLFGYEEC